MKKKTVSIVLCIAIVLQMLTSFSVVVIANDNVGQYDVHITESTAYTATSGENIKVSGEGTVAEITLQGVTIDKSSDVSVSVIRIENGATAKLIVKGTNTLRSASGSAGISVDETSTLIIEEISTGTLNVYGGLMAAGIGGDAEKSNGTVIINGGTINAYGGDNAGEFADDRGGAGIGGGNNGSGGNITINDGTIYARGGDTSAGIGGGNGGSAGIVVINNGTIETNSGYKGASIGGRGGSVTINGGYINASGWAYGAAIGCDEYGSDINITITGGKIYASSSSFCAAIGGSWGGSCGSIVISGGEITARGDACGIGQAKSITISGGTINATAQAGGTGIMSNDITISDGIITAVGGSDGAGIGGSNGTINISGGTITATGGYNGAGIGGRSGASGGTITITGGSIKATPGSDAAEAVGSGASGSESVVTNGNEDVHLVAVEGAVNKDGTKLADLSFSAGSAGNEYTYKYFGYGHINDAILYFYLPNNFNCLHIRTTIDGKIESTCCEAGYTGDTYCIDCGEKIASGTIIPATGNHTDEDSKWESDGMQHWHTCYYGTQFDVASHTGGTATCTEKARCTVCGAEYGNYTAHQLTHHNRVEPDYENDGNIEYWTCDECGKYFSDSEGRNEISADDVVIAKLVVSEYQFIDGEVIIEAPAGAIPEGSLFDVQKIVPPPAEVVEKVKEQMGASSEVLAYYEIRLSDTGGTLIIHLDGEITIKTKMPEQYVGSKCVRILQEDENGKLIVMESWWESDYLCYKTDWLEIYN